MLVIRDIVDDVLKVAAVIVAFVFHRTLHLSGADQTVIVTVLSGLLTSKYAMRIFRYGIGWFNRVDNGVATVATTVDPALAARIVEMRNDVDKMYLELGGNLNG